MSGTFRRRNCKCPKEKKKCSCGAKWTYRYHIIDPITGKRKQKETPGFATIAEAKEEAKRIQYELQQGTYVEEKNITFEQFADEWLEGYKNTGKVKVSTIRLRGFAVNCLKSYFGKIQLKSVTRKQYQDMLNDLFKHGKSKETMISYHNTGKMVFNKAIELELIKKDPTEYAELPRRQVTVEELEQNVELPKYLEKEELDKFLETAKTHWRDERDYPLFLTLAYTGLRVGELCALKWADIDFEEQTISIVRTLYSPGSQIENYTLIPPKTKKSRRIIDVDKLVLDELEKYRAVQNKVRMKFRDSYHDHDFIFAELKRKDAGYPIPARLVRDRMGRLLKIAGIKEYLTPHSLRHTHTSLLAEAEASLEEIMHRLGHTNDATTKQIYLHVTKPKRKAASQKFANLMRSIK